MVVHNVPEASDINRFANLGRSKTSTEYHRITCFGGRNRVGNYIGEGRKCMQIFELSYILRWTTVTGVYLYEICVCICIIIQSYETKDYEQNLRILEMLN